MKQFVMKALAGAMIAAAPLMVMADSNTATGSGALSTSASLDFKIVVPKVLFLRVGAAGSINEINFSLTSTQVATPGTAVTTNTGGDATNGVNVTVIGNSGNVALTANAPSSGLQAATAGNSATIAYAQIVPTTSDATLPHPVFGSGAPGAASTITASTGVVNKSAIWTFAYGNASVVPADTYGGSAKGGRVVYAAAVP